VSDTKEKAEIDRGDGKQVDDAEETSGVTTSVAGGDEAGDVLDGEESGEGPLGDAEVRAEGIADGANAFEKDGKDTEENEG